MPTQEGVTNEVACWRAEIIHDILSDGLKSGGELVRSRKRYLGSADGSSNPGISVNVLTSPPDFRWVLYETMGSAFPVLTERSYEPGTKNFLYLRENLIPQQLLTVWQRTRSSLLVVGRHAGGKIQDYFHQVNPEAFSYLVFPQNILDEYMHMGNPVVVDSPIEVVTTSVRRQIGSIRELVEVPNYELALVRIIHTIGNPVWVHAVRLPTEEDVMEAKIKVYRLQEQSED